MTRATKGAAHGEIDQEGSGRSRGRWLCRILWDDEIKGFGLRIAPGGTKSYVLSYRAGRGRNAPQHRITIGKHGSPWTPDQVRQEARRLLGTIAAGDDPAAARKAEARAGEDSSSRSLPCAEKQVTTGYWL
jgi:hypothetical protein